MSFKYTRTVRFADTDAAGVVYFANVLSMCHETYEAALAAAGIDLKSFFSNPATAFPIVHTSVDLRRPICCGDRLLIHLTLRQQSEDNFELAYQVQLADRFVAIAITKHVCIDPASRTRQPLPAEIEQFLQNLSELCINDYSLI
ncbi:MAG: acyl-CoA thioesterase [Hormoscilla sp. SP5CHS1]|nr:acyl-CoA thioesterase [Hormoscilla sp. SP12CHS1]MBC6454764.1 acyl-CoA thioesterase [Hormoscilla sp. SP5CHS1]MBC6471975.1 acyl-CoA thioesterase [Hormoscilla sp. GM102CHS1]